MADTLRGILNDYDNARYATNVGTVAHRKLRGVHTEKGKLVGDAEFVKNVLAHPELAQFFNENARTEVPISAIINGKFVSRRIDRLVVDDANHIVHIIDYKTDVNRDAFHEKYVFQLQEYISIINKIYPKYKVVAPSL